jgi:hypothetical protein
MTDADSRPSSELLMITNDLPKEPQGERPDAHQNQIENRPPWRAEQ